MEKCEVEIRDPYHPFWGKTCGWPATHRVYHGREDLTCCIEHQEDAKEQLADELHLNNTRNIEMQKIGEVAEEAKEMKGGTF